MTLSAFFIYIGTGGSGTTALLNPLGANQPGILPFTADYVVHVSSSLTATLYSVSGGDWTAAGPADVTANGQLTDLLLPFADLEIANPAAATLHLLGVASTEGELDVWATVPDKNLGRPWNQYIEWPGLGSGIVPGEGVWADAPVDAVVVAYPDPAVLVGPGDAITLTLHYSNTGSANLPQLTFSGDESGAGSTASVKSCLLHCKTKGISFGERFNSSICRHISCIARRFTANRVTDESATKIRPSMSFSTSLRVAS